MAETSKIAVAGTTGAREVPGTGTPPSNKFIVHSSRIGELRKIGFSGDEIFTIVGPRRTLDRRIKTKQALTQSESDRVMRLERIMQQATRVLGTSEKANAWLRRPNRALSGAKPIELLESETGAVEVSDVLGRVEFGMFA